MIKIQQKLSCHVQSSKSQNFMWICELGSCNSFWMYPPLWTNLLVAWRHRKHVYKVGVRKNIQRIRNYRNPKFGLKHLASWLNNTLEIVFLKPKGRNSVLGDLIEKFLNSKLNYEETHGKSLQESILLLITCNFNHCLAMYSFSKKSYDENKTNFHLLAADAIVFAIAF